MLDNSEATLEISNALNALGDYTMSAADFASSMENMRRSARVGGRGRGIVRPRTHDDGLGEVRLAAQLNRLQPHAVPVGHLATTEETLTRDSDSEITAGMRAMGIYGADGTLQSGRTRRTVLDAEDIHVDGHVPVILNGDLFQRRFQDAEEEATSRISVAPALEPYDPQLPLAVQFTTIPELQQCVEKPTEKKSGTKSKAVSPQHHKSPPHAKGKKTKWRKVPTEELMQTPAPNGRYEIVGRMNPGINADRYFRTVVGEAGTQYLTQ